MAALAQTLGKQQLRVRETQTRLLDAAEEVFVRDGYEAAQLDEIAAKADRSKGAVYTHFESKEDLFLALFEHRTRGHIEKLLASQSRAKNRTESFQSFREFYVSLVSDRNWPILMLEFKLFALRHPQWKERLRKAFEMAKLPHGDSERSRLFGEPTSQENEEIELATVSLGPILSGLLLESHFEPEVLSGMALERILGRLFDSLFISFQDASQRTNSGIASALNL